MMNTAKKQESISSKFNNYKTRPERQKTARSTLTRRTLKIKRTPPRTPTSPRTPRMTENQKAKLRKKTRKINKIKKEKEQFDYPLLVVFDIDETLIQFLNKNAYKYFESLDSTMKEALEKKIKYKNNEENRQCILFRPGLQRFFKYINKHNTDIKLKNGKKYPAIKIALWTYSENEYAKNIMAALIEQFNLDEDMFLFRWGEEDMFEEDYRINYPKDLELIWNDKKRHELQDEYFGENDGLTFGKTYNKFNTIFLDDRYGNIEHENNRQNSILVKGFEPFGHTKIREPMTNDLLNEAIKDDILEKLIEIIEKIKEDHNNCSEEERDEALNVEHLFDPKKIVRKGLNKYLKEHKNDVKLITLGNVYNAFSLQKGGKRL